VLESEAAAFIVLFGLVIASRFVSESGFKLLSGEQKVTVIDAFSAHRKYSLLIFVLLISPGFFFPGLISRHLFLAIVFVYFLSVAGLAYRKLSSLNVKTEYIHRYLLSLLLVVAGFSGYTFLSRR
jgi:hypothetical protein